MFQQKQFMYSDKCTLKPTLWKRMRDDVLIIWDHGEEKLDELLWYSNVHEERIQFTIEKEVDGVLPFLDLLIKRESNCLTTKVYRKNTHTFWYVHWRSNHSEKVLLGVMKGLIHRAHRLYVILKKIWRQNLDFSKICLSQTVILLERLKRFLNNINQTWLERQMNQERKTNV